MKRRQKSETPVLGEQRATSAKNSPRRHRKHVRVELSQTQRLGVLLPQSLHPCADGTQVGGDEGVALPQDGQGAIGGRRRTLWGRVVRGSRGFGRQRDDRSNNTFHISGELRTSLSTATTRHTLPSCPLGGASGDLGQEPPVSPQFLPHRCPPAESIPPPHQEENWTSQFHDCILNHCAYCNFNRLLTHYFLASL